MQDEWKNGEIRFTIPSRMDWLGLVDKVVSEKRDSRDNPINKVEMKVRLTKRQPIGPSGD